MTKKKLNILYLRIFNLLKNKNFSIDLIQLDNKSTHQNFNLKNYRDKNKSFYKNILKLGFDFYNKISNKFVRDEDAFIINTFLPTEREAMLEISLGQFPQFWKYKWSQNSNYNLIKKLPDTLTRENLKKVFR